MREGLGQSYKLQNGGQGNNRGKREVSVEIMLKKLEGYMIKIYLYLINLKVSTTILTDSLTGDSLPTD